MNCSIWNSSESRGTDSTAIAWVPHTTIPERKGRESTTEQSLGENKAELVVWAYLGTHEISN